MAIDFYSTLVAGTGALVHELLAPPDLEVQPIRADADPTWDGDVRHRPE